MMDSAKVPDPSSCDPIGTSTSNTIAPAEGTNPVINDVKPGPIKLSKGIENAKKRLRAFSIQKKSPITPVVVPKPSSGGTTTVLIGKLSSVKPTAPKLDDEQKKILKPPKPGSHKKCLQDSYVDLQKRTLAEIEDMKRKMELVELGIPLGLICPTSSSEKAMPTKAMPPIKHFLGGNFRVYNSRDCGRKLNHTKLKNHPAKVDEIIREAKKARDEGRKYKFDYQKLLPNYDNPFQRKKEEDRCKTPEFRGRGDFDRKRKIDRYDSRRHSDHKRDDRDRYKTREKEKDRDRIKEKKFEHEKVKTTTDKEITEANVNLNDYLICDSWSLDNEDRNSSSPKGDDKSAKSTTQPSTEVKFDKAIPQLIRDSALKNKDMLREYTRDSPVRPYVKDNASLPLKMGKLQPVIDSFKFEIDPNDEEILDIFDEDSGIEKYARKEKRHATMYSPTDMKLMEYDQDESKDVSVEDTNDDTFLESVINEIKQEDINEDISQDKALVEYDISPVNKEVDEAKSAKIRMSITPELDDRMRDVQSQRSDYSDGYRSNESGYKTCDTSESDYKSVDSFRMSMEKELSDISIGMSKSTVDSLETWSFVLKICQPILFRHDKNKCYRETRVMPKLWYTENPKLCNCVKDRKVVYEELQLCKMNLVDRVYGCDQIPDAPSPKCRNWYPRPHLCLTESHTVPVSKEWEGDDMGHSESTCRLEKEDTRRRSNTPQRNDEGCLDREYQRFMKSVWPEVAETKNDTPRSTTPVRPEEKKRKREEVDKEGEVKKPAKKLKLSSEGWSQESDLEEELEKSKKVKIDKEKLRKRKRSSSTLSSFSDSEPEAKKKKKAMKKSILKKSKWKSAKRRRIGKKILKKLKEKEKKKKKQSKMEKIDGSDDEDDSDKKINKKLKKKKKQQKLKKMTQKRKKKDVSMSSSSSSSSDSSTDTSEERSKKSKRSGAKKKKEKRHKRKSTSDSAQSEELFDVNILNNIKTERLTDDEKTKSLMDFSPRRQQKPREIINVKELQNDFVGNNIHIKKESVEETTKQMQQNLKEVVTKNDMNVEAPDETIEDSEEKEEAEVIDLQALQHIPEPKCVVSATVSLVSPTTSRTIPSISTNIDIISIVPPTAPQTIRTVSQVKPLMDESNMSQCSSQESVCSVKPYEKDDSHLRPSSQNSNYSFNDVINASQTGLYQKNIEPVIECEDKFHDNYQQDNYEMFEHLAMAYQSDVASQQAPLPCAAGEQRIETVVRARSRGEIKCDWRAGLSPALLPPPAKPSRWGLKPGEVNIVLTGGSDYAPQPATTLQKPEPQPQPQSVPKPQPVPTPQPIYKIQSLANRTDVSISGYDEAYMDMYGASDRLQYGDCFAEGVSADPRSALAASQAAAAELRTSTLDARIDYALKTTVLGEVAKVVDSPPSDEKEVPEKGILILSSVAGEAGRAAKRVSFADGYKPGQDSDVEEPPVKKKRKTRRTGCAWPCPASHPDHVALWDALPPPPPPPGSPPPPHRTAPPLHLLRPPHARAAQPAAHLPHRPALNIPMTLPPRLQKLDTNSPLPVFIPSEPPPSIGFP